MWHQKEDVRSESLGKVPNLRVGCEDLMFKGIC